MKFCRLRQVRPSGVYEMAIFIVFSDFFLKMGLHAIELKGRKELAVGHGFDAVFVSADADKFFNMRIPRRHIIITDGPVQTIAKPVGCSEFKIAPPLRGASPRERLAADLVATDPI